MTLIFIGYGLSVHVDIHSKTMNYSLGVFFQKWVENSNCSYFARIYVYMSCSFIAKTRVIARLVSPASLVEVTPTTDLPSHNSTVLQRTKHAMTLIFAV